MCGTGVEKRQGSINEEVLSDSYLSIGDDMFDVERCDIVPVPLYKRIIAAGAEFAKR